MYYVHVVKKVYMYGMQPSLNTQSCIKRPFCSTLRLIRYFNFHASAVSNYYYLTFMLLNC